MMHVLAVLAALLVTTGCQSAGLYLANTANDTDAYTVKKDTAYGEKPWQKLDIYWPKPRADHAPVIVFYYGGGWQKGSKEDYEFVASRFVKDGFIVIIPDYVKYPEGVYPDFVEDAAEVTRWLDQHVKTIGGDDQNIHIVGHSAGAHIGAMLLADETFLATKSLSPGFYRSFVGISGPYSFEPGTRTYRKIFGSKEKFPLMQADRFIHGDEPPMLLIHAESDWLVNRSNMDKMVAAIQKKNGKVKTVSYPKHGHLSIIGSFSGAFPLDDKIPSDVIAFLKNPKTPHPQDQGESI